VVGYVVLFYIPALLIMASSIMSACLIRLKRKASEGKMFKHHNFFVISTVADSSYLKRFFSQLIIAHEPFLSSSQRIITRFLRHFHGDKMVLYFCCCWLLAFVLSWRIHYAWKGVRASPTDIHRRKREQQAIIQLMLIVVSFTMGYFPMSGMKYFQEYLMES